MALTIEDFNEAGVPDDRQVRLVSITFDSSYPTGGEALTPSDVNLDQIDAVLVDPGVVGYVFGYVNSTQKIKVYEAGADADELDEVANATDLSAVTVNALVVGS